MKLVKPTLANSNAAEQKYFQILRWFCQYRWVPNRFLYLYSIHCFTYGVQQYVQLFWKKKNYSYECACFPQIKKKKMPESVLGQNVSITISTINLKKKKKKYETTTLSIFPAQITGRMTCNQIEPNWWSPKSPFPVVFFFFFSNITPPQNGKLLWILTFPSSFQETNKTKVGSLLPRFRSQNVFYFSFVFFSFYNQSTWWY